MTDDLGKHKLPSSDGAKSPPETPLQKNQKDFEVRHPHFFANIVKIWSDIDDKNYKICTMLLDEVPRQDIADHFVITIDTVNNHCSVIGKKLATPVKGLLMHLRKIDRGLL